MRWARGLCRSLALTLRWAETLPLLRRAASVARRPLLCAGPPRFKGSSHSLGVRSRVGDRPLLRWAHDLRMFGQYVWPRGYPVFCAARFAVEVYDIAESRFNCTIATCNSMRVEGARMVDTATLARMVEILTRKTGELRVLLLVTILLTLTTCFGWQHCLASFGETFATTAPCFRP